jgi:hypothetical protein
VCERQESQQSTLTAVDKEWFDEWSARLRAKRNKNKQVALRKGSAGGSSAAASSHISRDLTGRQLFESQVQPDMLADDAEADDSWPLQQVY